METPLTDLLDSYMRFCVFELLNVNQERPPEPLATQARAFEEQYNARIADPLLLQIIPHLTPTFHKVCAALLVSPTLVTVGPETPDLLPKTLPAACVGCNKEWKQTVPTKGAEYCILYHEDVLKSAQLGQVTYPSAPIGFWACTGHVARIKTIHKCIHFMTHIKRDLGRLLPEHIRKSPQVSWESLVGPVYIKKPIAKWPTSIKENGFPIVTSFATHKKTLKNIEGYVEVLIKGPKETLEEEVKE